jgi:release factor glutamine methyltransferase
MLQTLDYHLRKASLDLTGTSPTPRLDAEVLLGHTVGMERARLYASLESPLALPEAARFAALVGRRRRGEPIAYLTGYREFWSMDLRVTASTLIPRPATETLVEAALSQIPRGTSWTVADLGTGSGAVALAIARERPRCRVLATDISPEAMQVATENAARHALSHVEFTLGDWFEALHGKRVHLIVANPPYVADHDPTLAAGDVRFEPILALEAGTDGLAAIRRIVQGASRYLLQGGWLALEHGSDQARSVRDLLVRHGYGDVRSHRDLDGLDRVTMGRWPCQISPLV